MIECYGQTDFRVSRWSGGETRELFLFPSGTSYKDRNFALRLSSATIELPTSTFTHLQGVKRFITPITHPFLLEVNGNAPFLLSPFEVFEFSGNDEVRSYGMSVDFNLMLNERLASGWMRSVKTGEEIKIVINAGEMFWIFSYFPSTVVLNNAEHGMDECSLLVVRNVEKEFTFFSNEPLIYGVSKLV